jgi:hypothetical protein
MKKPPLRWPGAAVLSGAVPPAQRLLNWKKHDVNIKYLSAIFRLLLLSVPRLSWPKAPK